MYVTLGVGEAALVPLLLWEAFRAGDAEKAMMGGGLGRRAALVEAGTLVPLVGWRGWVFGWRRWWFGGGRKGGKES